MGLETATLLAISAGISAASAGAGAYASYDSARRQNNAIEDQAKANNRAIAIKQQQLTQQADVEKLKREREAAQITGRLQAAAGDAGLSLGSGSHLALQRQVQSDLNFNLNTLQQNLANSIASVRAGGEISNLALSSQVRNPLLESITGSLNGASAGLQIGSGILNIDEQLKGKDLSTAVGKNKNKT